MKWFDSILFSILKTKFDDNNDVLAAHSVTLKFISLMEDHLQKNSMNSHLPLAIQLGLLQESAKLENNLPLKRFKEKMLGWLFLYAKLGAEYIKQAPTQQFHDYSIRDIARLENEAWKKMDYHVQIDVHQLEEIFKTHTTQEIIAQLINELETYNNISHYPGSLYTMLVCLYLFPFFSQEYNQLELKKTLTNILTHHNDDLKIVMSTPNPNTLNLIKLSVLLAHDQYKTWYLNENKRFSLNLFRYHGINGQHYAEEFSKTLRKSETMSELKKILVGLKETVNPHSFATYVLSNLQSVISQEPNDDIKQALGLNPEMFHLKTKRERSTTLNEMKKRLSLQLELEQVETESLNQF